MMTNEEKQIFEYELEKLNREYETCTNDSLKSKIKEDISFLQSVLRMPPERNDKMNRPDQ
jgi:hypothetical protein